MSLLCPLVSPFPLSFIFTVLLIAALVNADIGTVLVQDSVYHNQFGFFSTHFIGVRLDQNNRAVVNFVAGDEAASDYVISTETRTQSEPFFDNTISLIFLSSGTWWVYLAAYGTTLNWDYVQIRIVSNSWSGEITPKFQNPPFTWRTGYPPYGVPFTSDDTGTGTSDGSVATLPSPTLTSIPSSPRSSKSISVWLAPLLVGIIMIAITVPIVIVAYKKGKQHSKPAQIESEAAIENQAQQQIDQANQVQV